MVDMSFWLGRKYAMLQEKANAGSASTGPLPTMPVAPSRYAADAPAMITTGQTAGQVNPAFLTGEGVTSRNVGDTQYTQYGKDGMIVIRPGQGSMLGKIRALASAGYDIDKATRAVAGASAATLDDVTATLKPDESAAENIVRRAQARLTGVQADLLPSEVASQNAVRAAQTANTGVQTQIARKEGLDPDPTASTAVIMRMLETFDPTFRLSR
jgi:hypothetical protein